MASHDGIKQRLHERIGELKTLRDEIRLDLHLASMDLRDEWRELERKLPDAQTAASEIIEQGTKDAIETLATQLHSFRARLREYSSRV
jgi:hypothetical protein